MADLTSEEIMTIVRREFASILEEDTRSRMRFPGAYKFEVFWPMRHQLKENWADLSDADPWERRTAAETADAVRDMLHEGTWPELRLPVLNLLKRNGIDVDSDAPVVNEVCHLYGQAMVEALTAIKHRNFSNIDYTPAVFLEDSPANSQVQQIAAQVPEQKRTISTLIREYSDEKKRHGWTERSERTIMERLNSLTELMGDVDLASINHDFAFEFRKKLMEKPRKRQSAESKASGKVERIAPGTVNNIIADIAAMFKYAKRREWVSDSYFSEMTLRDTTPAHKKRQPFTKDELALLFGPGFIKACGRISWRFWLPLLGLFTGARLDEIAQAQVDDVREIDGIWCLVVESSDEKSVKTLSGNRSIPLHSFIVNDLGFLKFVDSQRAEGERELFPGLKRVQGRKGHYLTKWFGEYRDALGILKTRTFHSLRKNFSKCLALNDVPISMIKRLDGHSLASDVTEHHYIQDIPVSKLREYVNKLDFGIELSHLKESSLAVKD